MIDGMTDKPKSSIAPLFQSGAIKMTGKTFYTGTYSLWMGSAEGL